MEIACIQKNKHAVACLNEVCGFVVPDQLLKKLLTLSIQD